MSDAEVCRMGDQYIPGCLPFLELPFGNPLSSCKDATLLSLGKYHISALYSVHIAMVTTGTDRKSK